MWLSISKDHEVRTFVGVRSIQDEMEAYNIRPPLFESVTNKLIESIETTEESKQSLDECIANIAKYQVIYAEKEIKREEQVRL